MKQTCALIRRGRYKYQRKTKVFCKKYSYTRTIRISTI